MSRRTKLVSIVLALMLAVSTFAVLSFSASAAEDEAGYDWDYSEATADTAVAVDRIELISLPTKTEYIARHIDEISLEGLEYNVYYTDGTVRNEKDDSLYVNFKYTDLYGEECYDSYLNASDLPIGESTITLLYMDDCYSYNDYENAIEFAEYTVNVEEDPFPSTVKSIEIIKKPDKVFTDVYHFYDYKTEGELYRDDLKNNSVFMNMNGAQMQINFIDGTSDVYSFNTPETVWPIFAYWTKDGENMAIINVTDLGDYKAQVECVGKTIVFEVNHTGAEDPDNTNTNPTGSVNTTVKPIIPSPDKNSTSGTATSDVVANTNGNGTVQTGNMMYPIVILAVLVIAGAVLVISNRKRYFK